MAKTNLTTGKIQEWFTEYIEIFMVRQPEIQETFDSDWDTFSAVFDDLYWEAIDWALDEVFQGLTPETVWDVLIALEYTEFDNSQPDIYMAAKEALINFVEDRDTEIIKSIIKSSITLKMRIRE